MRLRQRNLNGQFLTNTASALEVIESYPDDKYLPSFLLRGEGGGVVFHAQIAADVVGSNVRVVTLYVPDQREWENDGRVRRSVR